MRIHIFTHNYPIPYKPYYDTQFADLIEKGHDITVFAIKPHGTTLNEKVIQYRLAERTRYFPSTLGTIRRRLPEVVSGLARHPVGALGKIARIVRMEESLPDTLRESARMLSVYRDAPDLCLIHGLGTAVLLRWIRDLWPGIPVAMYYHGGEVPGVERWREAAVRDAFDAMDVVFTNTRFSADNAIERGCPPEKLYILPVGFALQDFQVASTRSYRPDGTLRLLSAGRMSEEKGFIFALQALKSVVDRGIRDISYSLTGEGHLRPTLERFVDENGLAPYVRFLGSLSTAEVLQAMEETDALLLPSIRVGDWVENQACAVQEAMLMKALVITSQTGGVPESIAEEMRPFSVPPGDPVALAEAIASLHALPVEDLRKLGEAGREFVVGNYDIRRLNDVMLDRTIRAFRGEVVSRAPLRPAGELQLS